MDPVPKRLIREQDLDHNDNNGEDLISSLPDCILTHILTKLPTKFAVGTTILSTRWKHLFASIPQPEIDFDDSLVIHSENDSEADLVRRLERFAEFNYRVLNKILKEVPFIRKLTLKCTKRNRSEFPYDDEEIVDWVSVAIFRSVVVLDIDVSLEVPELLFDFISGSRSLLSLTLRNFTILGLGLDAASQASFSLPVLRNLILDRVTVYENEHVSQILSGCQLLQSLTMSRCCLYELNLDISSDSLKHLSIESCLLAEASSYGLFKLDAPALEEISFEDNVPNIFFAKNLDSIRVANIKVLPMEGAADEVGLEYNKHAAEFVRAFSNVKTLHLSKDTISALEKSVEQISLFSNLIELHLGGFDTSGWKLLPRLLENAPYLELLRISDEIYQEEGCYELFKSNWPDKIPVCLLSALKKIEILKFKGENDEMFLISYFLIMGKVLDKLEITCDSHLHTVGSFREVPESSPRLSETCEILFRNVKQ